MNLLVELLDKQVHVISTPVVLVLDTVRVIVEQLIVRNRLTLNGIWVEIVVHMYSVYIIAAHDILCHLADIVAVLLYSRIQNKQLVVSETV